MSQALRDNLENDGFSVSCAGSFNETQDHHVARISLDSLLAAIDELAADKPLDALFTSCTNLRTHAVLEQAQVSIGCPVISSNSALAWHIQVLVEDD